MKIPFSAQLVPPSNLISEEFDSDAVLINTKDQNFYGLDRTALRMWQVVTKSDSIESAYKILQDEFEVDPAVLKQDLEEFLSRALDKGILIYKDTNSGRE